MGVSQLRGEYAVNGRNWWRLYNYLKSEKFAIRPRKNYEKILKWTRNVSIYRFTKPNAIV